MLSECVSRLCRHRDVRGVDVIGVSLPLLQSNPPSLHCREGGTKNETQSAGQSWAGELQGAELWRASPGSTALTWFLLRYWSCSTNEASHPWVAGWQSICGGKRRSLPGLPAGRSLLTLPTARFTGIILRCLFAVRACFVTMGMLAQPRLVGTVVFTLGQLA